MSMTTDEFASQLRTFLEEVHGPLPPDAGYTDSEIVSRQPYIGCAPPPMLLVCYTLAGNHPALADGLLTLVAPPDLGSYSVIEPRGYDGGDIEGLVFMHNREGTRYYSIHPEDYSASDPPVYSGAGQSTSSSMESSSLSACMMRTACLNLTALLTNGSALIHEPQLEKISYMFDPVGEGANKDELAFHRGRFVVRAKRKYVNYDYFTLTVASKSREDLAAELKRLEKALDVSFEVNEPQDLGPKVQPNWVWYAGYPH